MARSLIQLNNQGNKKSSGGQRFEASEHWEKFEKGVEVRGGVCNIGGVFIKQGGGQ